ncbi:hypothetical protein BC829DRAFT_297363 [Chytridium lagenaria]|nr:hypothetical protein BC829DRAFT_297363 [Chytridium lagenaria]
MRKKNASSTTSTAVLTKEPGGDGSVPGDGLRQRQHYSKRLMTKTFASSLMSGSSSTRWLLSTLFQIVVLLLLSQRSSDRTFKVQPYIISDPFFEFPTPRIRWIDPRSLVPHEHTSAPHLAALIDHLYTIPSNAPLPIPVCTQSEPRIILDGHHRVAASIALGLTRIPVWVVDDDEENRDWDNALIKVYARSDGSRMKLAEVVDGARGGRVEWGIKGTRHVAVVSSDGKEVTLERVTPRVLWGVWASGGRPCGRYWSDWDQRLAKPNSSTPSRENDGPIALPLSGGDIVEVPDLALDSTAELAGMDLLPVDESEVSAEPATTTSSPLSPRPLGVREMLSNFKDTVSASFSSILSSISSSAASVLYSPSSVPPAVAPNHTVAVTTPSQPTSTSSLPHLRPIHSPSIASLQTSPQSSASTLPTTPPTSTTASIQEATPSFGIKPVQTLVASLYGLRHLPCRLWHHLSLCLHFNPLLPMYLQLPLTRPSRMRRLLRHLPGFQLRS